MEKQQKPTVAYHKKCNDCGHFLKKEQWVRKDHPEKKHALCSDCLSGYDHWTCQ